MTLTAERCNQILSWAGKIKYGVPENPPSDPERMLSVDRILARQKGGRL